MLLIQRTQHTNQDIKCCRVFKYSFTSCVFSTAKTDCADSSRQHWSGQRRPPAPDWRERDRREVSGETAAIYHLTAFREKLMLWNCHSLNQNRLVSRGKRPKYCSIFLSRFRFELKDFPAFNLETMKLFFSLPS